MTGGVVIAVWQYIERRLGHPVSWQAYWGIVAVTFIWAAFLVWRDQYRKATALEGSPEIPREVRNELQSFHDEGIKIRPQIIADTYDDPWAPVSNEPNGWFVRVRNYLYTALGLSFARATDELPVSTALPPYPYASLWSSRKCDAIRHLDIRLDFLQRAMSQRTRATSSRNFTSGHL